VVAGAFTNRLNDPLNGTQVSVGTAAVNGKPAGADAYQDFAGARVTALYPPPDSCSK